MKRWSEMTPRERDALVAERVMGWTDFSPINPDVDFEVGVNGHRRNYAFPPDDNKYQSFPCYTTEISAAWEAVEKMKHGGWNLVELNNALIQYNDEHWHYVCFNKNGKRAVSGKPTAPEAICLAALRALRTWD